MRRPARPRSCLAEMRPHAPSVRPGPPPGPSGAKARGRRRGLASADLLDDHRPNPAISQTGGCSMRRRFALLMLTAIPLALAAGQATAADIKVISAAAVEEPVQQVS